MGKPAPYKKNGQCECLFLHLFKYCTTYGQWFTIIIVCCLNVWITWNVRTGRTRRQKSIPATATMYHAAFTLYVKTVYVMKYFAFMQATKRSKARPSHRISQQQCTSTKYKSKRANTCYIMDIECTTFERFISKSQQTIWWEEAWSSGRNSRQKRASIHVQHV